MLTLTQATRPPAPVPGALDLSGTAAQERLHLPQAASVRLRSNGFVHMASLAVTLNRKTGPQTDRQALAIQAVNAAYRAFPGLAGVDVAVFDAGKYLGFASRTSPPLLTLSVPAGDRRTFARALKAGTYPRVWPGAPSAVMPPQAPAPVISLLRPVWRGPAGQQAVALTFDDAPHPLYTPLLLDLLRRYDVPATFFVIGQNAERYPYFVQDMVRAGHQVGNHTYSHAPLTPLNEAEVRSELARTSRLLRRLTGQDITVFRPPGGGLSQTVLRAAAANQLRTVMWSHDAADYLNPDAQGLEAAFAGTLHPGQITLLHDKVESTVSALPAMIQEARARQYVFKTVDGLLNPEPARRLVGQQPGAATP
ncbi:polysaccharide deacetylase family protein [Deinococcus arcticus]|uniref:Polysaccharide deacetylase family protein n=2 Tax=Deinococcus arcticus TaxID=2136176 RepID=A0A2T3WAH8_9DEIO|nr:polysaccharide deacetylase family protein [Deinococcus arcticus]